MTVIAITAPQAYSVSFSSTSSRMAFLPACWQQQYSLTWWLSFHQSHAIATILGSMNGGRMRPGTLQNTRAGTAKESTGFSMPWSRVFDDPIRCPAVENWFVSSRQRLSSFSRGTSFLTPQAY